MRRQRHGSNVMLDRCNIAAAQPVAFADPNAINAKRWAVTTERWEEAAQDRAQPIPAQIAPGPWNPREQEARSCAVHDRLPEVSFCCRRRRETATPPCRV